MIDSAGIFRTHNSLGDVAIRRHGKQTFHWCDNCGVLLFSDSCQRCGSRGRPFKVSLPGDVRPCFGRGIDTVRQLFDRYFGLPDIFNGRLVFLNKISGEDRTDEIILEGRVIGVLRYRILENDFSLDLRLDGARMIAARAQKGVIRIKEMKKHIKGRYINKEDIIHADNFEKGDPLVVISGNLICTGLARKSFSSLEEGERAITIRDVGRGRIHLPSRASDWNDFVAANEQYLRRIERKAINDIRSFLGNSRKLPVTVSFSGGKDSLACYGIVRKAAEKFTLIFNDTGLEFPETVEFVRNFARKNRIELLEGSAGNSFWENLPLFGPPAKDYRWCCKICKLAPITELIERNFPEGTITVEGNRIFESFTRSRTRFCEKNPFVPGQINLNPIRNWRAAEVWGYIWLENLEYNPIYECDIERIGCYLCPSSLASEWHTIGEIHPELYERWEKALHDWCATRGLSDKYISLGLWRWKRLPPKMLRIAKESGIQIRESLSGELSLRLVKGASPCAAGGYSVEGIITLPAGLNFPSLVEMLKTAGKVRYSEEYQIALIRSGQSSLKIFGGSQIVAVAASKREAERLFMKGVRAVVRSYMCTLCGICERSCPRKAITIKSYPLVDETKCICCGECEDVCVVSHYFDKILEVTGIRTGNSK